MEQYNGNQHNFESWVTEAYRLYKLAFEQEYIAKEEGDLDLMLFQAMNARDEALIQLRQLVTNFMDTTYPVLIRDFVQASDIRRNPRNSKLLHGFHIYVRTLGHSRPFVFQKVSWTKLQMKPNEDPMASYQKLKSCFHEEQHSSHTINPTVYPIDEEKWTKDLIHWGEHIKTEVCNDGFDSLVIGKKLLDLIATVALIHLMTGV